jgi:hypothetical protein
MARKRKVEDNKIPNNTRTKESSSVAKVLIVLCVVKI